MISLSKIAQSCGVSVITVSRALDPQKAVKVKPETRKKILEVCARENFYPSFSARCLASGKTRTIGFIIPGMSMISKSTQTAIYLEEMNRRIEENGYNLVLLPVNGSDWETIRRNAEQLILSNRCDGYLTAAFTVSLPSDRPVTVLQTTSSEAITESDFPVIKINSDKAMQDIIAHLAGSGYRKTAFIQLGNAKQLREEIWKKNFSRARCMSNMVLLQLAADPLPYPCDPNMQKIMLEHFEEMLQYDAWIFNNDWHAILAKNLLEQKNIEPGKNIALVGFDNVEKTGSNPEITTIMPPLIEFGKAAADLILERINHPEKDFRNTRVELESRAIFRKSTQRI